MERPLQLTFAFAPAREDRFETYVVDDRTGPAYRACRRFVEEPPEEGGSLVLHGEPGSGKTHLLGAMVRDSGEREGAYLDASLLLDAVAAAPLYADLKGALATFGVGQFLAIDRLELVEGNEGAEEQVFHLFNAMRQRQGLFVAAVAHPPARWRFFDHLKSRLLWGETVEVVAPGDDGKVELLIRAARQRRIALAEPVARYLVTHLPRDPATQMAALERLDRESLGRGERLTLPAVRRLLEERP